MAIDSGAIRWNQWTPAARKCLNSRVGGPHGRRALALIIRWSKVQILQGPPNPSKSYGLACPPGSARVSFFAFIVFCLTFLFAVCAVMTRIPPRRMSVSVRLPVTDIERARKLAGKRGVGYQTLDQDAAP